MDVFELRNNLVSDYESYIRSFISIQDERIREKVEKELGEGLLWPDPLIQLNPSFESGKRIDELVAEGILHQECSKLFRMDKERNSMGRGQSLRLYKHQEEAIRIACKGRNYVLTTGTGSGKSLSYIIPIVNNVLSSGRGKGIKAIVVYPMNALANSQYGELEKFLCYGYPDGKGPVTFERYTGQESNDKRKQIIGNPPDILLTNYVMLELILTRPYEKGLVQAAQGFQFLVLDELHTYRGRQGADVALLVRRVRDLTSAENMQCVGTSATLATPTAYDEQRAEIAELAKKFFGTDFSPEDIIGETLRRTTSANELSDPSYIATLTERIKGPNRKPPDDFKSFINDPLSIWIESAFGVTYDEKSKRLVRAKPITISGPDGAANKLSLITGLDEDLCTRRIQEGLLAGYTCQPNPEDNSPAFAFRLHQFMSRGDTVYASIESEENRYITVHGQQYVPNDRERVLLPLVFCRECGQEYYCVRVSKDKKTGLRIFEPRDLNDRLSDEESEAGFLYFSADNPWPIEPEQVITRVPDDWLEESNGSFRIRSNRRKSLPQYLRVNSYGFESEHGIECNYIGAPFRFCLDCGVSYGFRQSSDFAKLTSLGSGGRSTAATIMSLSIIRHLRLEDTLPKKAQKLLSFTDNRQDASLQAGHFNDFIEVGLLRSALYRAVKDAGPGGLHHDELTQKVFAALSLPFAFYASDTTAKYAGKKETERTFRDVLGYRLYRDLRRGWRVTSPNLEQCGLLEISYLSLEDICRTGDDWKGFHPTLADAKPETRLKVTRTLLNYMRRELAIKVEFLDPINQERIQQRNNQRLSGAWAIDENERMEYARELLPRPRKGDRRDNVYLSPRGGFGQYLRRQNTFLEFSGRLSLEETSEIINQLLKILCVAGIVSVVREPDDKEGVPGYQIQAGAMIWKAGDGTRALRDPINVPNESAQGGQTNSFFIEFYKSIALDTQGVEAKEHTAQVPADERIERENKFREGKLPILYCSPTMELGVDISELNVVNLRNIPPTPANYAQRSGRAGRSGQPALVFSYCSTGSSHDQYFFKRPHLMVSGAVTPPRLDLANEDLVRAHVQAIWLTETGQSLGSTLCDILDVNGDQPSLELLESVQASVNNQTAKDKSLTRARNVLTTINEDLEKSDWYGNGWLDEVFLQVIGSFDQACNRWRSLYRAALEQAAAQSKIILDASRSNEDKKMAERLRREAEAQLKLLTDLQNVVQSDFYSYRYFASEGFLPGYNFPRLPLSAYIPGRRRKKGRDEFLSRPRFLAISEFGPRAIIYHEGSRYIINKVILPVEEDGVLITSVKHCEFCGYLHPERDDNGPDLCERCQRPLTKVLRELFRLQNVSTKRREKINSDEEERLRLGYDLKTGFRFAHINGHPCCCVATVKKDENELAKLTYGHAATLYRINLGWTRRKNKGRLGYVLDLERGYWAVNEQTKESDEDDPLGVNTQRVIPYVEDRRNCLIFEPQGDLNQITITSLQSALKNAIQVKYQLEDNELAAESLPDPDNRRLVLFYESTEGGAGVLRRLIDDPNAMAAVAREALRLCHFAPDTGSDLRRAPGAKEDCEAACYNCIMNYSNQRDHKLLDRQAIRDILLDFTSAKVEASPTELPRSEHIDRLMRQVDSSLEREWLQYLNGRNLNLPSHAQKYMKVCNTRPDFFYENHRAAIYVDGPIHKYPDRCKRDEKQTECMEDDGYTVIRFGSDDDWSSEISKYPNIFGGS